MGDETHVFIWEIVHIIHHNKSHQFSHKLDSYFAKGQGSFKVKVKWLHVVLHWIHLK